MKVKKLVCIFTLVFVSNFYTHAQTAPFQLLCDSLFINAWIGSPEALTKEFIEKYISMLARWKHAGSTYTGGMVDSIPPNHLAIHTLIFSKHPYIDQSLKEGQLSFFTRESEGHIIGLLDIRLSLAFATEGESETAFNRLVNRFEPVSKAKRVRKLNETTTVEFTNPDPDGYPTKIKLVQSPDPFDEASYRVYFAYVYE